MRNGYLIEVVLVLATFTKPTVQQVIQNQTDIIMEDFKLIVTEDKYTIEVTFKTKYDGRYWQNYMNCSVLRKLCEPDKWGTNDTICFNGTCSEESWNKVTILTVFPQTTISEPSKMEAIDTLKVGLIVLVGALAILLIGVTCGWMCTCHSMKKRQIESKTAKTGKIRLDELEENNTNIRDNMRQLHNPTYESSDAPEAEQVTPNIESSYEVVPPVPERSTSIRNKTPQKPKHEYEIVDRVQTRHRTTPLRPKPSVDTNRGSRFSKQMHKRGSESQEDQQHIYHVLEGPSTDV